MRNKCQEHRQVSRANRKKFCHTFVLQNPFQRPKWDKNDLGRNVLTKKNSVLTLADTADLMQECMCISGLSMNIP